MTIDKTNPRKKGYFTGRPTKYEPWMCERVIECGKQGMYIYEIAAELGVCRDTIHDWSHTNKDFAMALKLSKDQSFKNWARIGRDNMHNKDFNSGMWMYLGKCQHNMYDRPSETSHTINVVDLQSKSLDELDEIVEAAK